MSQAQAHRLEACIAAFPVDSQVWCDDLDTYAGYGVVTGHELNMLGQPLVVVLPADSVSGSTLVFYPNEVRLHIPPVGMSLRTFTELEDNNEQQ